jgi:alpha-tubulin suppressor-like RCC1 family protein
VHCWGSNAVGQLGLDGTTPRKSPGKVSIEDIHQIAAGGATTCAIDRSGRLFCWGRGFEGQLADDALIRSSSPVEIRVDDAPVSQVSVGTAHVCAVVSGGRLYCWGRNQSGQLGRPAGGTYHSPRWVSSLIDVRSVSCGRAHTCAVTSIGTYCWGSNAYGVLGIGADGSEAQEEPAPLDLRNVGSVYAGFSCGLSETNVLQCWGYGEDGRLGTGTTESSSVPVPVLWP